MTHREVPLGAEPGHAPLDIMIGKLHARKFVY